MNFEELVLTQCQEFPAKLYHYTTKDGFRGIIKNRQLWATNLLFQNDRVEFKLAFDILSQVVKDSDILKANWQELSAENFKGTTVYTVSFSEKFDILNQWDNYANSVPGYCIGFRTKELIRDFKTKSEEQIKYTGSSLSKQTNNAYEYKLYKCIYDADKQYEFINEMVKYILSKNLDKSVIRYAIYQELLKWAPLLKKRKYEEEKEWRFIITNIFDKSKINERIGKFYIIPYFELDFISPECIRDVYIGHCPELEQETIRDSTSFICYRYGKTFSLKKNGGIYFIKDFIK